VDRALNKGKTVISIGIKELLDSGVHFGHQTKRWNPKMKPFIFDARNGIHIIDLSKTLNQLEAASNFLFTTVSKGGRVIFRYQLGPEEYRVGDNPAEAFGRVLADALGR